MTSQVNKEDLRKEYKKIWRDDTRMVDYCVGQVSTVATLPNGEIIPVEKQKIEKRFCFGESGYDYDDALKAAQNARTNKDYFVSENMKFFNDTITALTKALNGIGNYKVVIFDKAYISQDADCKIVSYSLVPVVDIIDAFGGCCDLYDIFGKDITIYNQHGRIATPKEEEIIIEAYKTAAAAHLKKVNSYLKRYGLSQVYSWTYWRDA